MSKEEYTPIELRKHCIKTMQFSRRDSNAYKEHELILSIMDENISMKYKLDQLESDKQKLIEKLVKDKVELTEELKYNATKRESRIQLKLVDKYLEIVKGENQVTVK